MANILIVDDEKRLRQILSEILHTKGHTCVQAANAVEARDHLAAQDFDLMLSDISMPGESGMDLARFVLTEYPQTAVIIVSVITNHTVARDALEIGVYDYIIKPFRSNAVLFSVANVLHRRTLEVENRRFRDHLEKMVAERTEALQKSKNDLEQTLKHLKETRDHLIRSEKLASIGYLATGVAHEINNPTGFVSSNLNALADYQNDMSRLIGEYRQFIDEMRKTNEYEPAVRKAVKQIKAIEEEIDIGFILDDTTALIKESLDGMDRIRMIVRDLKDLAHPGKDKLESADINRCLESTLNVVWNELKYKATVTKELGDLPRVQCYPHQLNQVFMNLLVNAGHAIEEKGEIRIRTRSLDDKVEIVISDNGSGIAEENLKKIFDPFFTTKKLGKGTGLGLHLGHNIIKKHNGTIDVESELGKGTTFSIRIPIEMTVPT